MKVLLSDVVVHSIDTTFQIGKITFHGICANTNTALISRIFLDGVVYLRMLSLAASTC